MTDVDSPLVVEQATEEITEVNVDENSDGQEITKEDGDNRCEDDSKSEKSQGEPGEVDEECDKKENSEKIYHDPCNSFQMRLQKM